MVKTSFYSGSGTNSTDVAAIENLKTAAETAAASASSAASDALDAKITISTSSPSGGSDNDIWFQVSS